MTEEERIKLTRSNYSAQMAMLGYNHDGTAKDKVEVVRCKNCKHMKEIKWNDEPMKICLKHTFTGERHDNWFCADGEMKE